VRKPYHNAKFLLSCPSVGGAPDDEGYEVIFAGRSNAGKSSSINALTSQSKLAKVSRTPGRTQHLVFFDLGEDRRLVDLPGYGYAKVPEQVKLKWQADMGEYIQGRACLAGAVLVMDVRHPLKPFDKMMLDWCVSMNLPTQIILTKADKLKKGAASNTLLKIKREVKNHPYVDVQLFSSLKKQGLDELWNRLDTFFGYVN